MATSPAIFALPPTIEWTGDCVRLIDQTQLPHREMYLEITDEKQMWDAIRRLAVRGAPAIGVAAAMGAYLGVRDFAADDPARLRQRLAEVCAYLATARPTAVNLFWALERIQRVASQAPGDAARVKQRILDECLRMIDEDVAVCRAIGKHGLELLRPLAPAGGPLRLLTHCNAGSLATVKYGTALAPVYIGLEEGVRFEVFADETRPLLQGSRITAFELTRAGVPCTIICDNMAATVLSRGDVHAVIVGADRIAANGDVANKIGTLGLAILARHCGVPFYVAAPLSTIDPRTPDGARIPIEERAAREITGDGGAPEGANVFNPAFDVTPADLVSAIVTEKGVVRAPYGPELARLVTAPA